MPAMEQSRAMAAVVPPIRRTGGHPLAPWRPDVAPTVIAMAAEMGPDELTMRAVAHRMGLQDPQVWRVLPKGRADILFLVAGDLQMRQTAAVAKHAGLRRHTARRRVEAHLARMLAFDFEPGVKEWRRACAAQGWYWTREQLVDLGGALPGPFEPIQRDLGPAVAAVWGLYESTFKDACVMDWTQEQTTMELTARLQVISLGHKKQRGG
jgi:AcrR family transcriptional regulator